MDLCKSLYDNDIIIIIISFAFGIMLSWLTSSLSLILLTIVITEMIYFASTWKYGKWDSCIRICNICVYLLGWVVGRFIHQLTTHTIHRETDAIWGIHLI